MSGKQKGRLRCIAVIILATLVADLFAVAAAVAATISDFPVPLRFIQQHPWWSVLGLSLLGTALAVWQYRSDHQDAEREKSPEEVSINASKLKRSPVSALRGTRTRIVSSRLTDSPITIGDNSSTRPGRESAERHG